MDCSDPLVVQGTLKSLLQHLLQHKIFTGQKHQFFSMQISLYSTSNIHTFGFQYPMNTCIHMFVCKYASSFPLSVQLGVVWWAHMVTGVNIFRTYQTALIYTHTQIYMYVYTYAYMYICVCKCIFHSAGSQLQQVLSSNFIIEQGLNFDKWDLVP